MLRIVFIHIQKYVWRLLRLLWHSRSHLENGRLFLAINCQYRWKLSFICFYWVDAIELNHVTHSVRQSKLSFFRHSFGVDHSEIRNHWLKLDIRSRKENCVLMTAQTSIVSNFHFFFELSFFIWFSFWFVFFFVHFLCLQTLITGYNLVRNAWTHWIPLRVCTNCWCVHAFADTKFDLEMHAFFLTNWCRNCPLLSDVWWLTLTKHTPKSMSQMMKITHKILIHKKKSAHKTRTQDLESDLDDLNCLKSLFGEFFGK